MCTLFEPVHATALIPPAQRTRELEETRRKLAEESAARQRDALAREHAAKLERLKAEWRDNAAVAKARGRPLGGTEGGRCGCGWCGCGWLGRLRENV